MKNKNHHNSGVFKIIAYIQNLSKYEMGMTYHAHWFNPIQRLYKNAAYFKLYMPYSSQMRSNFSRFFSTPS